MNPVAKGEAKPASSSLPQDGVADEEGGVIFIGQEIHGVIDSNSDADVFQFDGLAGESVRIEVNADPALDPAVTLFLNTSRLFPGQTSTASSHAAKASEITRVLR